MSLPMMEKIVTNRGSSNSYSFTSKFLSLQILYFCNSFSWNWIQMKSANLIWLAILSILENKLHATLVVPREMGTHWTGNWSTRNYSSLSLQHYQFLLSCFISSKLWSKLTALWEKRHWSLSFNQWKAFTTLCVQRVRLPPINALFPSFPNDYTGSEFWELASLSIKWGPGWKIGLCSVLAWIQNSYPKNR